MRWRVNHSHHQELQFVVFGELATNSLLLLYIVQVTKSLAQGNQFLDGEIDAILGRVEQSQLQCFQLLSKCYGKPFNAMVTWDS